MKHLITIILILFLTISASKAYSQESKITRDPFAPYEFQESEDSNIYSERKFKLTGIIWDKENPSAVVQFTKFKKIIFKGSTIHTYKVTQITRKYIKLSNDNQKIMVKLGEERQFE
jgi:hypothetical protein